MSMNQDHSGMVHGSVVEFSSQSGDAAMDSNIETYLNNAALHFAKLRDNSQPSELPFAAENIHTGDKLYVPNGDHVIIVEVTNRHIIPSATKPTLMLLVEPVNE